MFLLPNFTPTFSIWLLNFSGNQKYYFQDSVNKRLCSSVGFKDFETTDQTTAIYDKTTNNLTTQLPSKPNQPLRNSPHFPLSLRPFPVSSTAQFPRPASARSSPFLIRYSTRIKPAKYVCCLLPVRPADAGSVARAKSGAFRHQRRRRRRVGE